MYESLQTSLGNRYRITGTCNTCRNNDELVPLDITDSKALERYLVTSDPAFVILAAGTKDVKKCEQDPGYAYRLNTAPVVAAAEIIVRRRLDARLLFLSTDYVFDGTRGCYRDIDAPAPGTIYGKSKMLAEQSLLASGIEGKIVRTSAVMGKGGTFFDWLVNELRTKEEVRMFDNIYFSPTPINLLDDMITKLLLGYESIDRKILHVNGEKRLSRLRVRVDGTGLPGAGYANRTGTRGIFDNATRPLDDTVGAGCPMAQTEFRGIHADIPECGSMK